MKKIIAKIVIASMFATSLTAILPLSAGAISTPNWDVTGNYVANFNYLGTDYSHDMHLTQDNAGNLTGNGGSPAGANTYMWTIDSGSVSGDTIDFTVHYTATPDAVTPLTTMHVMGTIAPDGSMTGTWTDNYQGGNRAGTWTTTTGSGTASPMGGVMTNPATGITSSDATLNGTNGNAAATGHSFWVSTSPFVTTSPIIPPGVYSTPDMGAIAANTPFSALLSSLTTSGVPSNMPAVTPNTTYYFAAWSLVNGTWMPGQVLHFTTSETGDEGDDQGDDQGDTIHVTIVKYLDGSPATANSAQNMSFPMTATWSADNIGSGTGTYTLSPTGFNNTNAYQATTSEMTKGADYTTNEVTGTGASDVGSNACANGQTYKVVGYSTGHSLSQAEHATKSMTAPAFTDLQNNRFVIVWNEKCNSSNDNGDIGGNVDQGNGVLHVDSIEVVKGNGTADNTYANGWEYIFHITDPNNEPNLAMKFSDWLSGSNTIPVANNMRISSAQASNPGPITLTAANTYSTPPFNMVTDLNPSMDGRQVDVMVEVKIPTGSASGAYSSTYGVQSTP